MSDPTTKEIETATSPVLSPEELFNLTSEIQDDHTLGRLTHTNLVERVQRIAASHERLRERYNRAKKAHLDCSDDWNRLRNLIFGDPSSDPLPEPVSALSEELKRIRLPFPWRPKSEWLIVAAEDVR